MYKKNLKYIILRLVFKEPDLKSFRHLVLVLVLNCFCFIQNFVLQDECPFLYKKPDKTAGEFSSPYLSWNSYFIIKHRGVPKRVGFKPPPPYFWKTNTNLKNGHETKKYPKNDLKKNQKKILHIPLIKHQLRDGTAIENSLQNHSKPFFLLFNHHLIFKNPNQFQKLIKFHPKL